MSLRRLAKLSKNVADTGRKAVSQDELHECVSSDVAETDFMSELSSGSATWDGFDFSSPRLSMRSRMSGTYDFTCSRGSFNHDQRFCHSLPALCFAIACPSFGTGRQTGSRLSDAGNRCIMPCGSNVRVTDKLEESRFSGASFSCDRMFPGSQDGCLSCHSGSGKSFQDGRGNHGKRITQHACNATQHA